MRQLLAWENGGLYVYVTLTIKFMAYICCTKIAMLGPDPESDSCEQPSVPVQSPKDDRGPPSWIRLQGPRLLYQQ